MHVIRLQSSVNDLKQLKFWLSMPAEVIGTFILVFVGNCSTFTENNGFGISLAFGFAGAVAIYCIGPISGGHINPAVSFSLMVARQISLVRFLCYSMAQIIGAVLAMSIKALLNPFNVTKLNTGPKICSTAINISPLYKLICEIFITFVLTFTVMRLCVEKSRTAEERAKAPLVIGLAITCGVLAGKSISGGSMNPAASISGHLFSCDPDIWVYMIGPLVGGALGALLQQLVFTSELSKQHVMDYIIYGNFGDELIDEKTNSSAMVQRKSDQANV